MGGSTPHATESTSRGTAVFVLQAALLGTVGSAALGTPALSDCSEAMMEVLVGSLQQSVNMKDTIPVQVPLLRHISLSSLSVILGSFGRTAD